MPFDTTPRTGFFSSVIFEAGNVGAERRENGNHAGARVWCAADDFHQRLALRDLDLDDLQLVGVRMFLGFDDARNS